MRRNVTLAIAIVGFVLVATGFLAVFAPKQAAASSVAPNILDGSVSVVHAMGAASAMDGQTARRRRRAPDGSRRPRGHQYFDGSTVTLEPNTELRIEILEASSSGDIVVRVFQAAGRTWHVIQRALGRNSRYEVSTPAATATVRGTAFSVATEPDGRMTQETTDGLVTTAAGGATVEVPPGFGTRVAAGGTPTPPVALPEPPETVTIIIARGSRARSSPMRPAARSASSMDVRFARSPALPCR